MIDFRGNELVGVRVLGAVNMLVDNPILNPAFEDPTPYWDYREGQSLIVEGRQIADYYLKEPLHNSPVLYGTF